MARHDDASVRVAGGLAAPVLGGLLIMWLLGVGGGGPRPEAPSPISTILHFLWLVLLVAAGWVGARLAIRVRRWFESRWFLSPFTLPDYVYGGEGDTLLKVVTDEDRKSNADSRIRATMTAPAEHVSPRKGGGEQAMICDICSNRVPEYLLTTRQVVSTPAYWRKVLPNDPMLEALGPQAHTMKASMAQQSAAQSQPWLVCEGCIELFSTADRTVAKGYAAEYRSSGGRFQPPGSGAVPMSAVDMGDDTSFE